MGKKKKKRKYGVGLMFALIQTGRSVSACVFSPPYPPVKKKKNQSFPNHSDKIGRPDYEYPREKNGVFKIYVELSTMTNWVAKVDK